MKWLLPVLGLAGSLFCQDIQLVQVATGVASPTDIQNARDGSGRLFIVQQNGVVRILRNGSLVQTPFLDIRNRISSGGERGLLGLAFPPGFAQKQYFYVNYTDLAGNTVIAQYRVSGNADVAEPSSEAILLHVTQPFPNHNGGQLAFGRDGYLYIGLGDGGSGGDPQGNGQNLSTLLGKILRVDVESTPGQLRSPSNNPFVNTAGARPEIWAYGLRNPWRFSFDRTTGELYIADVGQGNYEEVNVQPASSSGGDNYGWNRMEGMHCFTAGCNQSGLVLPVTEYDHSAGKCSVTGGYVYRGNLSPGLRGLYFYGDYCTGQIFALDRQGTDWVTRQVRASGFSISTFGEDEAGEVYIANAAGPGSVHRITGSSAPRISARSVVNSAIFVPGMTAGSLQTVFAPGVLDTPGIVAADRTPLPTSLSGVSITVNGVSAPIHVVANQNGQEQVNFQTPFEAANRTTSTVVVTRNGQSSAPVDVTMSDAQPAIYRSDGTQAVAVHNSTYRLVTAQEPLQRGEYAFFYATSLGAVTNQPATGAAAASSPLSEVRGLVRVTLGGVACEVQFAGLAPGLVGVYQVNFRVPANAPGGSQDLVISVGSSSTSAAKIPVQ